MGLVPCRSHVVEAIKKDKSWISSDSEFAELEIIELEGRLP